jgi:hypothetical protein
MRAILLANATVATCLRLRALRPASHILRPEDCFVLCSSTVCAPKTKSFRRYLFPRLLVSVSCCLPPVECSPGTTPNQAANPRPFLKAAPLPMAAIVAVAIKGPIPGIATRRLHGSSSLAMRTISLSDSSICRCRYCISHSSWVSSTRNAPDSLLSGSSRMRGREA